MRPSSSTSETLLGELFADPAVDAAVGDAALVGACLEVEAALALATADVGLVPSEAAAAIVSAARGLDVDIGELGHDAVASGNPVPPLVTRLGAAVPETARPWVHLGATSQDVLDTALVLTHRAAAALIADRVDTAADHAAELATGHRDTVMIARSLGQHAAPTTFGLRAAGWLAALRGSATPLRAAADRLPVQLGGAVGTLAGYDGHGFAVRRALADRLGLPGGDRPLAWHTDRTPWLDLASALGVVAAAVGKVALDVRLLTATEVGEVRVGAPGSGGSSAMPHKRNPVEAILATAGVVRVPGLVATLYAASVHAHERADGDWHAEWPALRELVSVVGGVAARGAELLNGLTVDPARMQHNLELTGGAVMAESVAARLAGAMGRDQAHELVATLVRRSADQGTPLRETLLAEPAVTEQLDADALDAALDPRSRLGIAGAAVDEAVRRYGHRAGAGT
ncbi:MAG TPA: lyase family protein [Mycobacteriales bacterium]|nr:lyase family protein [Mycobacteriales bacterium]